MQEAKGRGPTITVSADNMQAYLYLPAPALGMRYTVREIMSLLEVKGVKFGIDQEKVRKAVEDCMYQEEILVAEGVPVVHGIPGKYEFFFSQDFSKKPKILPDGSADYRQMKLIETVLKGQVIAVYQPAIEGTNGCNVKGAAQIAKIGKELPPLKGRGFIRSEDGLTYRSEVDGKIERRKDRVDILPFYEIAGNAGIESGNINFSGDVVIHGNVESGVEVRSGGTITIDGVVEGAKLIAAKDIVLKSGMMGEKGGSISTKGNLFARFVEYSTLDVAGDIEAEVLLDCHTRCWGHITINGKRSAIIGGDTYAIKGITTNNLGSDGGIRTHIRVGVGDDTYRREKILEREIEMTSAKLENMEKELNLMTMLQKQQSLTKLQEMQKMQLLREKIRNSANLSQYQLELEATRKRVEDARGAKVKVYAKVHPGTEVIIDDTRVFVKAEQHNLEFVKQLDKVIMESLEGEMPPE